MKLSGGLYIALFLLSSLSLGGLSGLASNRATQEAAAALPLPMLVISIVMMIFLYKMWNAINDGQTRPSPGAAVGLMFIPFFSIYWIFVVWPGYASQYNAYCQRHGIQAPPLSMGFILCSILLSWIPLVGIVLMCMTIAKIAAAVNALSPQQR